MFTFQEPAVPLRGTLLFLESKMDQGEMVCRTVYELPVPIRAPVQNGSIDG